MTPLTQCGNYHTSFLFDNFPLAIFHFASLVVVLVVVVVVVDDQLSQGLGSTQPEAGLGDGWRAGLQSC